ncbi:MAG TPA: hypothetical protein VF339_09895 [Gammaproteobacteria bacterium]
MDLIPTPPDPFARIAAGSPSGGDLAAFLIELFFLPGNWLVWAIVEHTPAVARLLDIGPHDYGGAFAGCVSALVWIAALIVASVVWCKIRELDERLTSALVRGCAELCRRVRVARVRVACALARHRAPGRPAPREAAGGIELAEELELDAQTLRLLRAHAELGAGRSLPVSEAAAIVGSRRHDTLRMLARLQALELIRPAFGGPDGEAAYALTAAGRAFLMFNGMMPTAAAAHRAG